MMLAIALLALGAMFGFALAWPIAYALGGEHVHNENRDLYRARREARLQRRQVS